MEKTYQITESELQALLKEQRINCAAAAGWADNSEHAEHNALVAQLPDLSNLKEVTTEKENLVANDKALIEHPCDAPLKSSATIEQVLNRLHETIKAMYDNGGDYDLLGVLKHIENEQKLINEARV